MMAIIQVTLNRVIWRPALPLLFIFFIGCQGPTGSPPAPHVDVPPKPAVTPRTDVSEVPQSEESTARLAVKIVRSEKMIFDFERAAHVTRWRPSYISKRPFQAWDKRVSSKGRGSMAVDLDAGQRYPGLLLLPPRGKRFDWSAAENLRLEVYNSQDYPVAMRLRIDSADGDGRKARCTQECVLWPGLNHLRFPLRKHGSEGQQIDPARITRLIFFAAKPEKTLRLYIDEFRLESAAEAIPPFDNVFLFDFGTPVSPVMPGFTRVTPACELSPDKAFGFTTPPLIAGSADYRLDSLIDDHIRTGHKKRAEFVVKVPNGRYTVGMFVRSVNWLGLPTFGWSVSANGKLKQKHGVSAISFYSTKGYYRGYEIDYAARTDVWEEFAKDLVPFYRFETEVADGVLRITFESCSVHAMMIWPTQHNNWGQRLVRQVQQMRKSEFYDFNFRMKPVAQDAAGQATAVLAPVSYLREIGPGFLPPRQDGNSPWRISAAPGEYEPVALAFRAPVEYERISVRVSDFAGEAAVIPSSEVDVRLAKLFPKGEKIYELVPAMLEPVAGQTLRPNITREFLADVHVPENTPPGDYHGEVALQAEGHEPLVVRITVTVRPIQLVEDLPVNFSMYYGTPSRIEEHYRRFYGGYKKWEQTIGAQIRNMREHGFNTLTIPKPKPIAIKDGVLELDFSSADRLLRLCREHGLARRHPVIILVIDYAHFIIGDGIEEFSPRFNEIYLSACRQLVEWARKNDLSLLIWVVDEPREVGLNWWNRNLSDTLKYLELVKSVPNIRTYMTITSDKKGRLDYTVLADKLDVVACLPLKNSRKLLTSADLSLYNAGRGRLSWGFYVWKIAARGRREWGYQWLAQPYNPFDPGNSAITYPSPHGLLPTIHEKRIREGIDDYKYLYTLEATMAQAEAAGRDVSSASALLDEIRKALPDYLDKNLPGTSDLDHDLDAWRRRIALEIEKLAAPGQDPRSISTGK